MTFRDTVLQTNPSSAPKSDKQVAKSARPSDAIILTHYRGAPQYEPRLSGHLGVTPFTTDEMLQKVAQDRAEAWEAFLKSIAQLVCGAFSGIFEIFRRLSNARSPCPRLKIQR